jgi:radical SAM superfamily enzyme YgiQ (UPF0313 family)/glycosyltransferase involved in cell wall biosynthesis
MNIILIYPLLSRKRAKIDENKQFWPPLGLAYLASVLEKDGHNVRILDRDVALRKNGMDFDAADEITLDAIRQTKADIAGISVTTPNMPDVVHISNLIKKVSSRTMILAGGPHVTGEPILTLKEAPSVDAAVRGEGEITLAEIASGMKLAEIRGLTYRNGSDVVPNADRENISDIDELPLPARHLLDMKFYTRPSRFTSRNLNLRTTSIFTARGCPYRCAYCAGPLVFNGKVRFHTPGRVIQEIEELISVYDIEALYFAEDMFLSSKKRAEEILSLFIERGINKKVRWIAQAKANIITPSLLKLMKDAGCVGVEYGFESGSQRVLDLMNKRLKVEESLEASELTRKARLRFQANIIVGFPGENEADFRKTIDFIRKVRPNMVGFNIFMPLPGTASYEQLKRDSVSLPRWEDIGDPEVAQGGYADMPKNLFEQLYLEARLKVILPINLRNFIKDNIRNPLRLIKVGLTQFRGVVIKTARAASRLSALKKGKVAPAKKRVLYLSYNGLLEPIAPSQVIPYLEILARHDYDFTLLTYEKKKDLLKTGRARLKAMQEDLRSKGIVWKYLRYHKRPSFLAKIYDLLKGALYSLSIILRKDIRLVHVRGITPGIIAMSLSRIVGFKILFDSRGFLAEEYVGGGLWKEGGLNYRLVKKTEERMLKKADAVTVLTRKHLEINKGIGSLEYRNIPMDVVPCCVDTRRFYHDAAKREEIRNEMGLTDKFVLMYPGKIGTFYLLNEMFDFYSNLRGELPNASFLILTNDDTAAAVKMAKEKGLLSGIVFLSGLGFDEMPRYIRAADAGIFFINPYKKIGSSPIKMGEFLASGIPVVINPGIGDTEEIVYENRVGVVAKELNIKGYREAVAELITLKNENEDLTSRCMATANRLLSLDMGADKYLNLYERLLNIT